MADWSPYPGGPVYTTNPNGGSNVSVYKVLSDLGAVPRVSFGGSGSSARSVSNSSRSQSTMADTLTSYMDQIYKITDRNNAWSADQASQLRDWQARQNQIAMDFNSREAQFNREWQEMMSNAAHQREIKDLQAAGLNPVLSAMGGNGAAVTSGATASGVTSAGAKGDTDTSAASALVGLIGTMWSAQTQLESQRLTAQNNMAIAEKNNASAQAIAQMQAANQQQVAHIAGQYNLDVTKLNNAASALVARIHAGATVSSAQISAAAHQYAAQLGYSGTQLQVASNLIANEARNQAMLDVAQYNYQASIESAGIHSQSALDVAKEHHYDTLYGAAHNAGEDIYKIGSSIFGGLSKRFKDVWYGPNRK